MNIQDFLKEKQAARPAGKFFNFGSLREAVIGMGATAISDPRADKTGFHLAIYHRNAEGRPEHIDNLFFSKALLAKHQAVPYDLTGLLDQPVYGNEFLDKNGKPAKVLRIGVTQGSVDDINDLADLMAMGAVNATAAATTK